MGKIFKPGKIVVVLNGKYAGRKAVIVRAFDDGAKERKFGHAAIAGIDKYPRKITTRMSATKKAQRMRVKPFLKFVNFNHLMPTRYWFDSTVSSLLNTKVTDDSFSADADKSAKSTTLNEVRKVLQDRYKKLADPKAANDKHVHGVQYLFRKLRF